MAQVALSRLRASDVNFQFLSHPHINSIEEWCEAVSAFSQDQGTPCKVLAAANKRKELFLILSPSDVRVDLKSLAKTVPGASNLRVSSGELLRDRLGVLELAQQQNPAALCPFLLPEGAHLKLTIVLDASLAPAEGRDGKLFFSLGLDQASVGVSRQGLVSFLDKNHYSVVCFAADLHTNAEGDEEATTQDAQSEELPQDKAVTFITDVDDQRVDPYRELKRPDAVHITGLCIVEGIEAIRVALNSPHQVVSLLLKPSAHSLLEKDLDEANNQNKHALVLVAHPGTISAIAGFNARGALAAVERPQITIDVIEDRLTNTTTGVQILALDGCNDVNNMGALIRTAAALGLDCVLVSQDCCDPFYRRSVRVSMGHVFSIPVVRCEDLAVTMKSLESQGVCSVATVCDSDSCDVAAVAGTRPWGTRWCCVLGNEYSGVSSPVRSASQLALHINMPTQVDSLNINVAAGIFLFIMTQNT